MCYAVLHTSTVLMETPLKGKKHATVGMFFMNKHFQTNTCSCIVPCYLVCLLYTKYSPLLQQKWIKVYIQLSEKINIFFLAYTYQREVSIGRSSHVLTSFFITRKNHKENKSFVPATSLSDLRMGCL